MINVTILPDTLRVTEDDQLLEFEIFRLDDFLIDDGLALDVEVATVPLLASGNSFRQCR